MKTPEDLANEARNEAVRSPLAWALNQWADNEPDSMPLQENVFMLEVIRLLIES